jgi:hypothetical protein
VPWGRGRIGNVCEGGLVHILYEEFKDTRVYWTTQCDICWAGRDNTDRLLKPPVSKKPVTCLRCIDLHLRNGWPW